MIEKVAGVSLAELPDRLMVGRSLKEQCILSLRCPEQLMSVIGKVSGITVVLLPDKLMVEKAKEGGRLYGPFNTNHNFNKCSCLISLIMLSREVR